MDNINEIIQEYLDGVIKEQDEAILFKELSINQNSRNIFKQYVLLKKIINYSKDEIPNQFEKNVYDKILLINKENKSMKKKIIQYLSYAAMIIFLFLSVYYFNRVMDVKEELNRVNNQIRNQNKTIELLLNSLPAAEVQANYPNEIIIKSNL